MERIELHAKTKYNTDNDSTIDIKDLILKCVENNVKGVAIVDTKSNISFYKAEKILKELNIKDFKLLYGTELEVQYKDKKLNIVMLLKDKEGLKYLNRLVSNIDNKTLFLDEILMYKKHFVLGLIYTSNDYNEEVLKHFDYIEVDKNISKKIITKLKKNNIVIYTNKINALTNEELIAKNVLYQKLNKIDEIDNQIYQNTEEILKEINDEEIVVDNTNKIFNMINSFKLCNTEINLPINDNFDIDLMVYINLNKKFKNNIPKQILKRVNEELKLIHEFNYDGFINIYNEIIKKCKTSQKEYAINDNINYLYVAYILGITHFDPIKLDLNYDIFFSNKCSISIDIKRGYEKVLKNYIKEELKLELIKCKGLAKLNGYSLEKAIDDYVDNTKEQYNLGKRVAVSNILNNYPLNTRGYTFKYLVLPKDYNKYDITSVELLNNEYNTSLDYKDIEDKFLTIEIIPTSNIDNLNDLKLLNKFEDNNYKDKLILNSEEYKMYLKYYENYLILDDLYEDLNNTDLELPIIFHIINEIQITKAVSKKTKDILEKNNIKLKRYHNISIINRGILIEKTRVKYELLYFKYYYPLEYYYTLLNNCVYASFINLITKEYEEIKKEIRIYSSNRYEYYVLNVMKELYEANIGFVVKERAIKNSFGFEIDKENNQIILVLSVFNKDITKYLNNKISLIGTRPLNGKMAYLSNIIYKLLNKNKSITLFGLNGPVNYYVEYLLNNITDIERKNIHQYLNPCSSDYENILETDEKQLFKGIRYLLKKNINIKDYHGVNDSIIENENTLLEKIIYMINDSDSSIIIIDGIEVISDNIEVTLKKLNEINTDKNIILFTNLKREWEKDKINSINYFNDYKIFQKYINCINILDDNNIYNINGELNEN